MPRGPRKKSILNIYHIIIKGTGNQIMFECERDFLKYQKILLEYKEECNFQIYAYCLMSNHVHLLIKTGDISLETIFRKINTTYACWFNMKYARTGHLQGGRYYSEPINDEKYFLNVLKYIHKNPYKASLESYVGESYLWNSFNEYAKSYFSNTPALLIDSEIALSLLGSFDGFLSFHSAPENEDDISEDFSEKGKRKPDDVALEIMKDYCNCATSSDFQKLNILDRNKNLKILAGEGLSIRQINRITGVSVGVIRRVILGRP